MKMKNLKYLRSTQQCINNYTTTHECFAFILIVGQYFAMFPIKGLRQNNFRLLRFRWLSCSTIYTFIYIIGVIFILTFHIYNFSQLSELKFGYIVTLSFFFTSLVTILFFVRLAFNWPQLMSNWAEIDCRMRSYGFPKKLMLRLKITSIVVLMAALIEHGLYLATSIITAGEIEEDGWIKIVKYLRNNFAFVFNHLPFALWKGILLLMVNIMCTFTWNYMDLFIMLISMALTAKFKQITSRLKLAVVYKHKEIVFWKELRNDYNAVVELCRNVDTTISNITLISFANNLFVILIQLFHSLKPRIISTVGRIYFIYSFAFLVIRTTAVCLFAASVSEASKEPTALLLSVTPEVYNVEIERLLYKIHSDPTALTGKKFFNITKSLILHIAGAIVTYELVLIQFQVAM